MAEGGPASLVVTSLLCIPVGGCRGSDSAGRRSGELRGGVRRQGMEIIRALEEVGISQSAQQDE